MNMAARAAVGTLSPRVARKRAARAAGLRAYQHDLHVIRDRCRAPGCRSRAGIVRVTIDTTDPKTVRRSARVECAQCGHGWFRVRDDTPLTDGQRITAMATLIVPSGAKRVLYRVKTNGAWHVSGDDVTTIPNANVDQVMAAMRVWREAWEKREDAKLRARAKREVEAAADREATRAMLARMDARNAEREAEERAAAERERKGI